MGRCGVSYNNRSSLFDLEGWGKLWRHHEVLMKPLIVSPAVIRGVRGPERETGAVDVANEEVVNNKGDVFRN